MKKLALLFIAVITSCNFNSSPYDIHSALEETAQKINEKCPMTIDKDTRLDNVAILSNKTILYNYTLINSSIEDLNLDSVKDDFSINLTNKVKTNPGLKKFRENNVTMSYYYADKNGRFIFKHTVTPKMYN